MTRAPRPPSELAADLGLAGHQWAPYGRDLARVDASVAQGPAREARCVLVTAVTPTRLGEGKTTTAIGLVQGLARRGERVVGTLRQPSLGPTFGVKGGATGTGRARLVPADRIDLHLTGDAYAVAAAHNLLAAMVDNRLHHGDGLGLDPRTVAWPRVVDVDDRALRHVVVGLGGPGGGVPRETGFAVTAASEVMTVLSLATSAADLRRRLGAVTVGLTAEGKPVTAEDVGAAGAMAALLRDAVDPTLVQTGEGQPVLLHTGPFGNIATGCSSVLADLVAVRCADYVVTEAGFGADLGAERFLDVKCRVSGLRPAAAVLVTTVRATKAQAGGHAAAAGRDLPASLAAERPDQVRAGSANLAAHVRIVRRLGLDPVVAVNAFPADHASETAELLAVCAELGAVAVVATHVRDGGAGAADLADAVVDACARPSRAAPLYPDGTPAREALEMVAREVYGADGVDLSRTAAAQLARWEDLGLGGLPVCVAKTPLSLSADPAVLGAPTGWRLPVREVRACTGAGYLYALCGDVLLMPGLPVHPVAEGVDVTADGRVVGLVGG